MKYKIILPLLLCATTVSANEYQTFINFDYLDSTSSGSAVEHKSLSGTHYFSGKESLGPLGEFEFINRTTNIFANYQDDGDFDSYSIGGEYFAGDFLFGASHRDLDGFDVNSFTLGYLINDDFLVKAELVDPKGSGSIFQYTAQYNHQLGGNDYLGFSYTTDEDFDTHRLGSTYFTDLGGSTYFKASLHYHDFDGEDYVAAQGSYYFNKMTSVSIGFDDEKNYNFNVEHYLNKNYAINLGYYDSRDSNQEDSGAYRINLTAQF